MQDFPAECRTAISDLAGRVRAQVANAEPIKKAQTQRSRQIQYLIFCQEHQVPTPCGVGPPYEQLVACYAEWIISGNNYYNLELRSGTVREYLEAINDLLKDVIFWRQSILTRHKTYQLCFIETINMGR